MIACGALAGHVREIAGRRGWPIELHNLPALLHNHPDRIAPAASGWPAELQARGLRVALGYADCGSYGALDEPVRAAGPAPAARPALLRRAGRAGPAARAVRGEPGTYLLTDFLVRTFRRTVLAELGLDRHPDCGPTISGTTGGWCGSRSRRDAGLDGEAAAVAAMFGLPLTVIDVGTERPGTRTGAAGRRGRRRRGDAARRLVRRWRRAARTAPGRPLLAAPRYEVFPAPGIEQAVAEWVPRELTVTVTASPAKGLEPTLDLTERLVARGYRTVPHLSARLVRDEAHLTDIVARLRAIGVDDIFVPAGDADPPAGRFASALSLLEQLAEMGRPFARVGITGYPQSHPKIGDDITIQAMWDKRQHAAYLVSNLCFDPALLRKWISRVGTAG